ncbi:unnamed protein product [Urochloa humidicola]
MAPGRKRVPTPAAGVQPPPSGAPGGGEHANLGTSSALQMGCAAGGHQPMKRPRPAEFSEEHLTDYERVRAQTMMRNSRVFRSLGIAEVASILNKNLNAKSKGVVRDDPDPLYEPAGEEDDTEDGVLAKVSETGVRPTGGTRGSKRVLAGPNQQGLGERVMTRKRARDQLSSEGGTDGSNEEDDAAAIAPAAPAQVDEPEEMDILEGAPNAMINQRSRGRSMGKGLDKMCHGLNSKLPVVILEGKRRPEAPLQAAKLASESGLVLRHHMPIYTHWKEYKKDDSILTDFMGKVSAKFSMDTNDTAVKKACADLLKVGQRQARHKLKKIFFDDVPANEGQQHHWKE